MANDYKSRLIVVGLKRKPAELVNALQRSIYGDGRPRGVGSSSVNPRACGIVHVTAI
jgi:hypothetical protein